MSTVNHTQNMDGASIPLTQNSPSPLSLPNGTPNAKPLPRPDYSKNIADCEHCGEPFCQNCAEDWCEDGLSFCSDRCQEAYWENAATRPDPTDEEMQKIIEMRR